MAKKETKTSNVVKTLEKGIENIVKQIEQAPKEQSKKKPLQPIIKVEAKDSGIEAENSKKTKTIKNLAVEMLKGISVKKNENFSQWYTEVIEKC